MNVVSKFVDSGWMVTLLAPRDGYEDQLPTESEQVQYVPLLKMERDNTSPTRNLATYNELKEQYRKLRPDVILHYTSKPVIFGAIAAGKLSIPNVTVITGLGYAFIKNGWLMRLMTRLYQYSARYTSKHIFENQDDLKLFRQKILSPDKGISIKGCGVDTLRFVSKKAQASDGITVFTFVGRLLRDKGIYEYVEAASQLKAEYGDQVAFKIAGDLDAGNPASLAREDLEELTSKRIVEYLGFVDDVRPLMESSHCIVLPSYREGMPRTMMEALSMSRPVITTRVPGCREIVVKGENGYLVDAKSSDGIAGAMKSFVQLSYEDKIAMGQKGRKLAEEFFDHRLIADQLFKIVKAAM